MCGVRQPPYSASFGGRREDGRMTVDEGTPFRWALAGYGAGGRTFHQPLISSAAGLELVAVVTGSPDRQDQVRADLPGATPVGTLAELADLGAAGGTITTPTST